MLITGNMPGAPARARDNIIEIDIYNADRVTAHPPGREVSR